MNNKFNIPNLTEYEVGGLSAQFTFADGHAYHDMPRLLKEITDNMQAIWQEACGSSIPNMEAKYKSSFAKLINSSALMSIDHYSLCPTASNSIDIAGAWLNSKNIQVGLIEPAFDNLNLLLKRRNVKVEAITEQDLSCLDKLNKKINDHNLGAIFLVSPNNPTGFQLNKEEFETLCVFCKSKKISIILDTTFRFYSRAPYDEYETLTKYDNDFLVIEDTGKTWPTEDLKVSMMVYSHSIANEIRELYEEVYLCSSNFTVALLSNLIDRTNEVGIKSIVWDEVDARRKDFREAIAHTLLKPAFEKTACPMPMEWLNCSQTGLSDVEFIETLKKDGIALLPGRFFYWNSQNKNTSYVRASLMRSDDMLNKGLKALKKSLDTRFPLGGKQCL